MFTEKHTFTCPDIIYLRAKQKKYNRIALATNGLFIFGLFAAGKVMEARDKKSLPTENPETPTENKE